MTQGEKLDGRDGGHQERRQASERSKQRRITVPCSACDQPATIAFEPKDGEPVYCNDCFQPQPKNIRLDARSPLFPMKGSQRGGGSRGSWNGRPGRQYRAGGRGNR